jgi:serine/threonine-protein kinase
MNDAREGKRDAAHCRQVDRCFDEVLDAPEAEREAVLASLSEKYSDSVVAEVRQLVASIDSTHSILDRPAPAQVDLASPTARSQPDQVGRWRIRERLGEGGQGQVYVATKTAEQFEQTGALKVLGDHLSANAMQRFLRERQTLARLRHPNIAVLLDAGASEEGHPYLVSELIRGKTLDHYIDTKQLSRPECVKLLLPLVEAVAYAHQQFVLHRDIKPANVIVDESGVPYLLDFGVSAAIADAADATAEAETAVPYTPAYAAPEQILGDAVDVRTDCWALGALLYRALAGRSPFGAEGASRTIEAVLHRKAEPPSRDPELNAIVVRCLAKSIDDRYEDVGQLRDDLQAWLDNAPVRAASSSRRYLFGKWLERHRILAASASIVALSLIVGAGASNYQAQRAAEQRDRATSAAQKYETAVGLLVDVFNGANPAWRRGESPSAEDLLAEAYSRVTGMERRPGVQAALAHELSAVFLNRGEAEKAARLSSYAVEHFESSEQAKSERYANALVSLATAKKMLGGYVEAVPIIERSLRVQREHLWPTSDWRYAYTQNMLGSLFTVMGSHARAVETFGTALSSVAASEEAPGWLYGTVFGNYWEGRFRLGDVTEARQALAGWIDEHLPGAAEEPGAYAHAGLGMIALADGRYGDAQAAYSEAGRLLARVYGRAHRDVRRFGEYAEYARVLAGGEFTSDEQQSLLSLQDEALESESVSASLRLSMANHRLSLTPYLDGQARRAWVNAQAERFPVEPVPDRLLWHSHLLLRALSAHLAGLEQNAFDALSQAEATPLYDTSHSQWQRGVQESMAAFLGRGDADDCRALRGSLAQPFAVDLSIIARGLSCDIRH